MTAPQQPSLTATTDVVVAYRSVMAGEWTTDEAVALLGPEHFATGSLGVVHALLTLLAVREHLTPEQVWDLVDTVLAQAMAKAAAA